MRQSRRHWRSAPTWPIRFRPAATCSGLPAIVTIGSLVCALLYVLAFAATGFGPDGSLYGAVIRYWIGDTVGLVVTLPILLLLMHRLHRATLRATLESGAWWVTALLTCACLWFVFGRGEQDYFKFFYLLLLPVVWASARFGVTGAVLSSLLTQLGLIAAAQLALRQDLTLFELQALMVASTMTALLVGVLVDERTRAADRIAQQPALCRRRPDGRGPGA